MNVESVLRTVGSRMVSAPMTAALRVAVERMRAEKVEAVLATDHCATEGVSVLGLVTQADVDAALRRRGKAALVEPISRSMRSRLVVCDKNESLEAAIALMRSRAARHDLVMDREQAVGIISADELASFSSSESAIAEVGQERAG